MGLDFVGSDAHWSYSGFGRFRRRLWNECGFEGDLYEKYYTTFYQEIQESHDLYPLFNHSDCDGELTVDEMKKVYPAIQEIILRWEEDDYDRIHGQYLVDGMKECIKNNEILEFY